MQFVKSRELNLVAISLFSLAFGIIAIMSEEYRLPILTGTALFITFYYISTVNKRIDDQDEEIKKLGEKLNIHEQLVDIKSDIGALKNKCAK
jgi:hypothetical protein